MKNILITGGAGFIGSHTCITFLEKGFNIYIIDSFINSSKKVFESLKKILDISSRYYQNTINIFEVDIRDNKFLEKLFLELSKNMRQLMALYILQVSKHFLNLLLIY